MPNKIRVYGKAQNRTALGIAHAYMTMYPQATLNDIRNSFPTDINPDKGVKELFLPVEEAEKYNDRMSLYFAKPDEILTMSDDSKIAMAQVWSKPSFERMVEQGKLYDIEVAQFDTAEKGFGKKGGFRLEYLNGYVPPMPEPVKKGIPLWIWAVLALLAAGIIAAIFISKDKEVAEVEKIVEKEVVVRDTVYVQQIEDIEANFNAAQFEQGKAALNDDAKLALHDLAKVMRQNPDLKLRISGHTSSEGDETVPKQQWISLSRRKVSMPRASNQPVTDHQNQFPTGSKKTVALNLRLSKCLIYLIKS